jgi:hypothetical protein
MKKAKAASSIKEVILLLYFYLGSYLVSDVDGRSLSSSDIKLRCSEPP